MTKKRRHGMKRTVAIKRLVKLARWARTGAMQYRRMLGKEDLLQLGMAEAYMNAARMIKYEVR